MRAWSLAWNTATVSLPGGSAQVIQVRRTGKGCLSYVVGSRGLAAVIDASVDPSVYVDLAGRHGWKITAVLDTHIHADHLSRARLLAEMTGATVWLPERRRVQYTCRPLQDGQVLSVGAACLEVVSTPGHTRESACYVLDGRAVFTGATLFLSSGGRPDLASQAGEETRNRTRLQYTSLQRLKALLPDTLVLPGHTSEPVAFDGAALAERLAGVWARAELLRLEPSAFVETIVGRLPLTPANYLEIVRMNEEGVLPDDPTGLEAGANRCAVG